MTLDTAGAERVAQRRLSTLVAALPDLDLTEEVEQAARLLLAEIPTLPDYEDLDANHKVYYNVATGLRAASALLAPCILRANDGQARLKTPDYEFTFTVPSLAERDGWAAEIAQAVGYLVKLAESQSPPRQRQRFSMFGAAGVARVRARERYCLGSILRLYVPEGFLYDGDFTLIGPDFDASLITTGCDTGPGDC